MTTPDPHAALKCPTCESPDQKRHPAVQFEGEVQLCRDVWHRPTADEIEAAERKRADPHAALRARLETLAAKWRDAAVWEHDDMGNTQSAQTFDQCADELEAALSAQEQEPRP